MILGKAKLNASTNMNSSLSKISQYCHNFLKSLISGLRQYLIWSGWAELAAADPRKVGSHLSVGEQVGGVWMGQSISIRVGHSHFSYSDVSNQIPEKFEWSKWVQFWKTRYIRIFNVLHRDCLYFYHELQLSLIMVTSNCTAVVLDDILSCVFNRRQIHCKQSILLSTIITDSLVVTVAINFNSDQMFAYFQIAPTRQCETNWHCCSCSHLATWGKNIAEHGSQITFSDYGFEIIFWRKI